MQVKFMQSLYEADRHLKAAEYLLNVTLKLMDDRRILAKSLVEMQKTTSYIIDSVLYLHANKNGDVPNGKENRAKLFFCKKSWDILNKSEVEELRKILVFTKCHKETKLEFVRGEKLVLFEGKECKIITEKGLRDSIKTLKHIIFKLSEKRKV